MRSGLVHLLSLAFDKGEERSEYVETTLSDFHYSKDANVSVSSILAGALWHSARSLFRNPFKAGFAYTALVISGIIFANLSNLADIGLWLLFMPVLLHTYAWAVFMSRTMQPIIPFMVFVGTSAWIVLVTVFGQEQSLICSDCEKYFIQNQLPQFGPYTELVIITLVAVFVLTFSFLIFQLFGNHSPWSAASLTLTFLIEVGVLSQFLYGTDYLHKSWTEWVVVVTPMPSELAMFIYAMAFSWLVCSSIILVVKTMSNKVRVAGK
jgi:hypothetical protein